MQNVEVAVVGAGVSGMAAGLALQRAGLPFTIFEKADEVGGTWRENRYPGLTIDVPSAIYTFAGHRNPGWTRWMPGWREILQYHRDVSFDSGLREHMVFGADLTAAHWNVDHWDLTFANGRTHRASALICATGFLHHPRFPSIAGMADFAGDLVHSAQWNDAIEVEGRRVAVIGTGSTGVQLVSALGGVAAHTTLFQRTAQWVFPGPNFTIPQWMRRRAAARPARIERLVDAVGFFADRILGVATIRPGWERRLFGLIGRLHLRRVRDRELRRKLTPTEEPLCRRPILSSAFYRAVQRPDVSVVTEGIDRIDATGLWTADGQHHDLDVIVLATGFHAHDYMRPVDIRGIGGVTLDDLWTGGPYGHRSVTLPGFPNLFMVMGPHSPLVSISIHGSAERQARYAVQLLDLVRRRGATAVMPTPEATRAWLDLIETGMPPTVWSSGCASWYKGDAAVPVLWPYDLRAWRDALDVPDPGEHEFVTAQARDADTPLNRTVQK